jgi:hypothetical protein
MQIKNRMQLIITIKRIYICALHQLSDAKDFYHKPTDVNNIYCI